MVQFAGMSSGFVGLGHINNTVIPKLASGTYQVVVMKGSQLEQGSGEMSVTQ